MATTKKSSSSSPIARMKEQFGDKEKLVDRILTLIAPGEADRDAVKTRLLAVSNRKLLRLFRVSSEVKSSFGSTAKLAEAAATAVGKAKDGAYVAKLVKLAERTPARVLDLVRAATAKGGQA